MWSGVFSPPSGLLSSFSLLLVWCVSSFVAFAGITPFINHPLKEMLSVGLNSLSGLPWYFGLLSIWALGLREEERSDEEHNLF